MRYPRESFHHGDVPRSENPRPLVVLVHEGNPERVELAERPGAHSPTEPELTMEALVRARQRIAARATPAPVLVRPAQEIVFDVSELEDSDVTPVARPVTSRED